MDPSDIRERLVKIELLQEMHNEQLAIHMRRTELLEERQHAFLASLKIVETRLSMWAAVGAALIPLTGVALTIWRALH